MRRAWILLSFSLVWIAAALPVAPHAEAAPRASIVMDMRDGRVLDEDDADRRQHPASLTKMMTLYLVFEAVRDGRLTLDQTVRVSRHAASQPPSKLHLRAGQRVTIRDLVRAAALKSANDAAVVLAEAVSGSEREFARLMTRRARELGMSRTTFRNASGLTHGEHLSTARDMAVLGRHLFHDFPQFYNLFGRRSAEAAGRTVWNTNRLLTSYEGADGIKTGYTRAAGYNLVASAHRGEERIIAVVLGGRSSGERNRRAAELLDLGFARAETRVAMVPPTFVTGGGDDAGTVTASGGDTDGGRSRVAVAAAPMPPARPGTEPLPVAEAPDLLAALGDALAPAAAEAATPPAAAPVTLPPVSAPTSSSRLAPGRAAPPPERPGTASGTATAGRGGALVFVTGPAPLAGGAPDVAARPVGGMPLPPPRPGARSAAGSGSGTGRAGDWIVQLGAFSDHEQAVAVLAAARLGDVEHLAEAEPVIDREAGSSGNTLYLVRFAGMTRSSARAACREIKGHGGDCLAIAPRSSR